MALFLKVKDTNFESNSQHVKQEVKDAMLFLNVKDTNFESNSQPLTPPKITLYAVSKRQRYKF